MDIGLTAHISVMPALKPQPTGPELTAVFDIESAARPGDDTYSSSGKKAAGAEESEEEDVEEEVESLDEPQDEPSAEPRATAPNAQISFFA